MKSISNLRAAIAYPMQRLHVYALSLIPAAGDTRAASRVGVYGALAGCSAAAMADGIITSIQNATAAVKAVIGLITLVGVLVGLAFMFSALGKMYKKHNDTRDDITWGQIIGQLAAGALSMALTWLGVQFVVGLGATQSDIGRSL